MECYFGYVGESSDRVSDKYLTVNNFGYNKNIDQTLTTIRKTGRTDYQIIYIDKGYGDFLIQNKITKVSAGSVVIIYPGEENNYVFHENSNADYYWIHFSGTGALPLLSELRLNSGTYKTGELITYIEHMDKMVQAYASKNFTTETFMSAMLLSLLSTVSRSIYITDSPIHRIIEQIQRDKFDSMSNNDYAKMCGLSEYHFIRKFKKITGLTPHRYKAKQAVNKAIEMLTNSNLNISETAYALGFNDSLYFSRLFKKETGLSPQKYLIKYNKDTSN